MPKILINSSIKSKNDYEVLKDYKAILKDDKITYKTGGMNISILIKKDSIILERENEEIKITLEFKDNKKTNNFYYIKKLNLRLNTEVDTKKIVINDNSISVKYDLYINNCFSDTFYYNLEWRDIDESKERD